VPEEDNKLAHQTPRINNFLGDQIIDKKRHGLCNALEMLADQATLISTHILRINFWEIEAILIECSKASFEYRHGLAFAHDVYALSPEIFDNPKKDCVEDLSWRVFVYVDA
jgi:hypothetical protein